MTSNRHNHVDVNLTTLQRRVRVALGQEPGDLLLAGGQVVNVFTLSVAPANVIIADGWIAGVGPYDWPARERIDLAGAAVLPGLIEAHIHVESSLLTPAELARLIVPHGTTTLIADPHEVGNVQGIAGIDLLLRASEGLPLDFFFMAPSCVPAIHWDDSGAKLGPDAVRELLTRPRVLGLAEVMDFPAVLHGSAPVLEKVRAAHERQRAVDGHAPALAGRDLLAYVAAGIRSDHESTTIEEAKAKAALGMLLQIREGSAGRNLDTFLPLLAGDELGDWCLCSDDIHPEDIRRLGHLEASLRRVVAAGCPAAKAVRHTTLLPARHYGLTDRGAVAPGYRADLLVVDNLRNFTPQLVLHHGQLVARDGQYLANVQPPSLPVINTVHLAPIDESAFRLSLSSDSFPVIRLVPGQLVTLCEPQTVACQDGVWTFDRSRDVVLAASIERHHATGRVGLGLVAGFGLRRGALGSSVAHDAHNLIVAGTNSRDLLACVRALQETGGGFVVVADGDIQARLPLPLWGLLATDSLETVCHRLQDLHHAARALGCPLDSPFGALSFLALPVIPALRVTDQGLFDVTKMEFVQSGP
ncbi:MAG: adenine deaminase [Gemmataceae bacterium]